jgi:CubicO group peptidase (beta-lactamase class C family)
MIRKLRHFRPSVEFRQTWHYNNIAYHIASIIPETLYGTPFASYTREHVLDKLRMNNTYFDEDLHVATRTGKRSQGFARRDQDVDACAEEEAREGFSAACLGKKVNIGYFDPALEHAAGHWGIVSSVKDLVSPIKSIFVTLH